MKGRLLWLGICVLHCVALRAQPFRLEIQRGQGTPRVTVLGKPLAPVAGTDYGVRLEASSDLRNWTEISDAPSGGSEQDNAAQRFFRAQTFLQEVNSSPDGADIYGYARIFQEELDRVGHLTPVEFAAANRPSTNHLPAIDFDPRTAQFWDDFNADPAVSHRPNDFRLNAAELGCFLTNGFVVSERLATYSFGDAYYRIFANDLPVFISADSVLHAWHYSYQRMLEEMEETQLAPALKSLLTVQLSPTYNLPETLLRGPLTNSIADARFFLTVAAYLLKGEAPPPGDVTYDTFTAIERLAYVESFPLFGATRPVDFSQFAVRGHYERTPTLGRYFRAMMWLSRVDFRMRKKEPDPQSLREFGTAIVLSKWLAAMGATSKWRGIDDLVRLFVGPAESLNMAQLEAVLQSHGIASLDDISSLDQVAAVYRSLFETDLGRQLYAGDAYAAPFGTNQVQLPRSFAHLAQRFTFDGWALAQVTFDRIRWNEDIEGVTWFGRVLRRYASATDVAYAVLGNRQVGPLLAERMLNTATPVPFRDGLPYAHNLTAMAATFDRVSTNAWTDSIYSRWLSALRVLSAPTTDPRFPQAMRTAAWAMRTLNTQLASYTQLKHDTVLYAKQPYASAVTCEYPAGFVEPVPEFWHQMQAMAAQAAVALTGLPPYSFAVIRATNNLGQEVIFRLADLQAARVAFCENFARQMAILANMAEKELVQQPFDTNEVLFIKGIMNDQSHGYLGPSYDGWYPRLFYKDYGQLIGNTDTAPCMKPDPLVTDIQTAPPDDIDGQGGVLHEGVGYVDMMLVAIDNGADKMVYAGPMLSHYEFIKPGPTLIRLTDSQWYPPFPPRPEWTRAYLVPAQ